MEAFYGMVRGKILYGMNPEIQLSREEQIGKGRQMLEEYLKTSGTMETEKQEKICSWVIQNRPGMLADLYRAAQCGGMEELQVYNSIFYCYVHKMDITIEDAEDLESFLPLRPDEEERKIQKDTFVKCWNKLGQMDLSEYQIIAVLANIYAESGFSAKNRKDTEEDKRLCDEDYVFEVHDEKAYGICQWYY